MLAVCLLLVGVRAYDGPSYGVKLCGREFIRAVIFTCGGSRWRRSIMSTGKITASVYTILLPRGVNSVFRGIRHFDIFGITFPFIKFSLRNIFCVPVPWHYALTGLTSSFILNI